MASDKNILNNLGYLRWYRFTILLDCYGKQILKQIFHTDMRAPKNGTEELYNFLLHFKPQLQNRIFQLEYEKIYPPNRITDEEKFDISLFGRIIIAILEFYKENNQFPRQKLNQIEKDKKFVYSLMKWRNWLCHEGNKCLSESTFEEKWQEAVVSFQCYRVVDMASVNDLKNCDVFSNTKYQDRASLLLQQGRVDILLFLYGTVLSSSLV